jgi:hypothetical protein
MPWDWVEKGTRRLQELSGEYKQHHALIERLLAIEPAAAQIELSRVWEAMDARARAGLKMTLAGLTLSRQAAGSGDATRARIERLKALQAAIEHASQDAARPDTPFTEASITSGAARLATRLGNVAERARPKAEQLVESARKGIEKHGPAVEAAVKSAMDDLLKPDRVSAPPPIREQPSASPAPPTGAAGIGGEWSGTLHQAVSGATLGCTLHVAPSGRPMWAYHDTSGFQRVELTHVGQRIQYVPPERGVVTVVVQSVTASSGETGYVLDYSYEGSSNGYLTQRYQRLTLAGRVRGGQLDVIYSEAGVSAFGDKTGLTASDSGAEYRGTLVRRQ